VQVVASNDAMLVNATAWTLAGIMLESKEDVLRTLPQEESTTLGH